MLFFFVACFVIVVVCGCLLLSPLVDVVRCLLFVVGCVVLFVVCC